MAEVTDTTNDLEDRKEFLRSASRALNWRGLVNEEILYIFCGSGRKYIRIFLQLFPKIRKVHFTDLLDTINIENNLKKTELFSVDIQDISKLLEYKNYFSQIVSIDCLNWIKDPKNGFSTIYHLLKISGTAAILMNINSPFEDCFKDLLEKSEWKFSDLAQESMFPKFPVRLSKEDYEELIKNIGFNVVECEEYNRIYEFESLLDFYQKCTSFTSPLMAYIPKDQQPIFENDFLDNFKLLYGFSYRGKPRIKCKTLSIFIRKPAPPSEASTSLLSTSYNFSYFGRF